MTVSKMSVTSFTKASRPNCKLLAKHSAGISMGAVSLVVLLDGWHRGDQDWLGMLAIRDAYVVRLRSAQIADNAIENPRARRAKLPLGLLIAANRVTMAAQHTCA